ncbi:MAG: 3-methyl-2-oxobutanoate hydroxymethyltransferase [Polyangiaceae bacterium]|nr:3-methyl-2-oxobutanoate hydroxymethyltransferase [Polyangiaceae bacterium]
MAKDKITAPEIQARKHVGPRIVVVTAYDATMASLLEAAGVDVLLVGDSLGMVVQGLATTLPVTLEEVCYHCRAVSRVARRAHVVGDLPFMSYQTSPERALDAAGRLVKEGGVEAVKLEGGVAMAEHVRRIVAVGIPVMGHVGLTPQSVHAMGGFRVQGKTDLAKERILADARALEAAGAYSMVVEGVPTELGQRITDAVSIPTIGIGAGPHCDGQVLVSYDLLGMYGDVRPKFVKRYAELGVAVVRATEAFAAEVRSGAFPTDAHSFGVSSPRAVRQSQGEPTGSSPIVVGDPASFPPASDDDA